MDGCIAVTDAGLAHLSGILTLSMQDLTLVTNVGLAHVRSVSRLSIDG